MLRSPTGCGTLVATADRAVGSDKFVTEAGATYAGLHLIADFWGASALDNVEAIGTAMRKAAHAAGATVLHLHLHPFGDEQGVSGVAVLAESHMSVHTWPERGYVAFDAFLCGGTDASAALRELERHFHPTSKQVQVLRRGTYPATGNSA